MCGVCLEVLEDRDADMGAEPPSDQEDGGRRRKTTVLITALRTAALNGIKGEWGGGE